MIKCAINDAEAGQKNIRIRATRYVVRFSAESYRLKLANAFNLDDALIIMSGERCHFCGKIIESSFERCLDHIIPMKHGGANEPSNIVLCCDICKYNRMRTIRFY